MPIGAIWLVIGTLVGVVAGWLLVDNSVAGGAAGFMITLTVLLVSNWLDTEDED